MIHELLAQFRAIRAGHLKHQIRLRDEFNGDVLWIQNTNGYDPPTGMLVVTGGKLSKTTRTAIESLQLS